MIIVRLQGGLGNQMFQYAAGRSLAVKYDVPLYLDHSFLERNRQDRNGFTARKFELDIFNIAATTLSNSLIDDIFDADPNTTLTVYKEKPVTYDAIFKKIRPNTFIEGYWQSFLYFTDYARIIEQDFTLKEIDFTENSHEVIEQIGNSNSVAIHIRRGDYVGHSLISLCPLSYYIQAIDQFINWHPNATFFVFCDDPDWAAQNLRYSGVPLHFVSDRKSPGWLDMYLMSVCNHNIIANSTFSWWAAWLNKNPFKQIIAPNKWFHENRKGINIDKLCLPTWSRI